MKKLTNCIVILIMSLPLVANADECPKNDEKIVTSPYVKTISCPTFQILIEGQRNPEKYESCLGLVPSASEQVTYVSEIGKRISLPNINSMVSDSEFKNRVWIVGDQANGSPDVQCAGKNAFMIGYYGGGNCRGCERSVSYQIDLQGDVVSTKHW